MTTTKAKQDMTELFIRCACGTEGINITQDEETDEVFFAMWYYGKHDMSCRNKLRWIWQILIGKPYPDEVVISTGWLPLLIDHLKAMKVDANQKDGDCSE